MRTWLPILGALAGASLVCLFVDAHVARNWVHGCCHTVAVGIAAAAGALVFRGRGDKVAWSAAAIAVVAALAGRVLALVKLRTYYNYEGRRPLFDVDWLAVMWPHAKIALGNLRPLDYMLLLVSALFAAAPVLVLTHVDDSKRQHDELHKKRMAAGLKQPQAAQLRLPKQRG
ncbi:MAG: hypothetical protein IT463_14325 [Planctomycetes bacterium]|nr:hypothetical protein [Planctomycetota bacterium]